MRMTLELPWPDRALSPNGSQKWRPKAKAKAAARMFAGLVAKDWINRHGWPNDVVEATEQVTFYYPRKSNRRRDRDNHHAMCKPYFDGLADAGVIANDCGFVSLPVQFVPADSRCIEIEIEILKQEPPCAAASTSTKKNSTPSARSKRSSGRS